MEDETSKSFFYPTKSWFWNVLTKPASKMSFLLEKRRVREYLVRQHNITTRKEAYYQADKVHELLSRKLGENPFFLSKIGRKMYPRSTDVVVYAYLVEELSLGNYSHVKDSLMSYENLLRFIKRMENTLSISKKTELIKDFKIIYSYFVQPPIRIDEEYHSPKLYFNVRNIPHTFYEALRYKLRDKKLAQSPQPDVPDNRRYFNTGVGLIFLVFLLIRDTNLN